jgi:hypothetical protein
MGAKGSEDPPFTELESAGEPTNFGQVIDITICNERELAVPSLEEPTVRTAQGLVDWKLQSGPVSVPSVYFKTEWVQRRLMPKNLSVVLDIPVDVARAEVLVMMKHFFEGTALVKREREQAMYPPEASEPKRASRDPKPADVPPPTLIRGARSRIRSSGRRTNDHADSRRG